MINDKSWQQATFRFASLLIAAVLCLATGAIRVRPVHATGRGIEIGLPAYVWPNDPFVEDLLDPGETPNPPSVVIANIENGSSNAYLFDDTADALRARTTESDEPVRVIGYVYTSYGNRSLNDVKASIDNWLDERDDSVHYDGIFFDEVPNTCGTNNATRDYYRELREYVWEKLPEWDLTVNNVGTAVPDCYLASGHRTADVFVTFEGSKATYYQTPSAGNGWVGWTGGNIITNNQYDLGTAYPNTFWHLVYDASSNDYEDVIDTAFDRYASMIDVTDDQLANPWDAKPSYLNDAIDYASTLSD